MRQALYTIVQVIWGFPQTLLGLAVLAAHARCPHRYSHGVWVTAWKLSKGMSLGAFVFVPQAICNWDDWTAGADGSSGGCDSGSADARGGVAAGRCGEWLDEQPLFVHEYGHTVQSAILGPAYLLVVGLPSLLWSNLSICQRRRAATGRSYYSLLPERTASLLGERVLKHPALH